MIILVIMLFIILITIKETLVINGLNKLGYFFLIFIKWQVELMMVIATATQ